MNFFSTHDVIEKHNNKPGVTFKLEHNRFSTMVITIGKQKQNKKSFYNSAFYNNQSPEEKKSFLGAVPQAHPHRKNNTRSLAIDDLITDRQACQVESVSCISAIYHCCRDQTFIDCCVVCTISYFCVSKVDWRTDKCMQPVKNQVKQVIKAILMHDEKCIFVLKLRLPVAAVGHLRPLLLPNSTLVLRQELPSHSGTLSLHKKMRYRCEILITLIFVI